MRLVFPDTGTRCPGCPNHLYAPGGFDRTRDRRYLECRQSIQYGCGYHFFRVVRLLRRTQQLRLLPLDWWRHVRPQ